MVRSVELNFRLKRIKIIGKRRGSKELDLIFTRTLSLLNHSSKNRKPPFIVAEQQMTDKKEAKQPATA